MNWGVLEEFSNCYCVQPKGRTTFQRYRINILLGLILCLAFWYSSEGRHFSVSPKGHLMHNPPQKNCWLLTYPNPEVKLDLVPSRKCNISASSKQKENQKQTLFQQLLACSGIRFIVGVREWTDVPMDSWSGYLDTVHFTEWESVWTYISQCLMHGRPWTKANFLSLLKYLPLN